jgi:hypothetical protein
MGMYLTMPPVTCAGAPRKCRRKSGKQVSADCESALVRTLETASRACQLKEVGSRVWRQVLPMKVATETGTPVHEARNIMAGAGRGMVERKKEWVEGALLGTRICTREWRMRSWR